MATWTNQSKDASSWTNPSRSDLIAVQGSPIGLLLALTQAASVYNTWSNQSKDSSSWSNQTKN